MILSALPRWAGGLALRLPRGLSYQLAAVCADLVFAVWPRRTVIVENMTRIVDYTGDHRSPRKLARQALRHYAWYILDFLRVGRVRPEDLERAIQSEDWKRFTDLIASGRGVIVAGMHTGNWDYAGLLMGRAGLPFVVVTDKLRPAALDRFVQGRRQSLGMTPVPVGQAARGVLRAIRAGDTVGILIDRPSPGEGIPVSFFGHTCYLPAGAAVLGLRTGAKVVPASLQRRADGSYELELDFEVEPVRTGNADNDLRAFVQQIVSSHERWIAQRPEQWFMFRQMWGRPAESAIPDLALADRLR